MNTKNIKHAGIISLAIGVVIGLGACSNKPSPWSQQSSPWDRGSEEVAQVEEQSPYVEDAQQVESVYAEPIEPMGTEAIMDEPVSAESGAMIAESMPMGAEPEPMVMEAEPMMEAEAEPMMMEAEAEPMMMEAETMMEAEPEITMSAAGGDISSQPASHFAVQVCASSSMENLVAFAKTNQLSDQWTAETSVDGKTWFVLLQGIYSTMAEAKSAMIDVETLETTPWVRSVGSLQAVIVQ